MTNKTQDKYNFFVCFQPKTRSRLSIIVSFTKSLTGWEENWEMTVSVERLHCDCEWVDIVYFWYLHSTLHTCMSKIEEFDINTCKKIQDLRKQNVWILFSQRWTERIYKYWESSKRDIINKLCIDLSDEWISE